MWNFKDTLWNSPQNILPIHWMMCNLSRSANLRDLQFISQFCSHINIIFCWTRWRFSIEPADGLAPLGAGASAVTMLTIFRSCLCTELAIEGLIYTFQCTYSRDVSLVQDVSLSYSFNVFIKIFVHVSSWMTLWIFFSKRKVNLGVVCHSWKWGSCGLYI